jgi:transposase
MPRIRVWLQKTYGLIVNHKRVYRLMKELGIRFDDKEKEAILRFERGYGCVE